MLLHGGRPAQTLYFSTSNGRTYGNDEIFGSAPLPYLRPATERDDGASPTSRWRATLRLEDLGPILAAAGLWPNDVPIRRVGVTAGAFTPSGSGTTRTIGRSDLRTAVNQWAPCLLPGRYPGDSRFGTPLPLTIPSGWYTAVGGRSLVLTGRGWGHGVGMVQWGAYGKARRGLSAADILGAYYGGLRPQRFPEPRVIDVEVASGLTEMKMVPSDPGATLDGERVGRGAIVVTGGGRLHVAR
jgi:stage II sporulation protein D